MVVRVVVLVVVCVVVRVVVLDVVAVVVRCAAGARDDLSEHTCQTCYTMMRYSVPEA